MGAAAWMEDASLARDRCLVRNSCICMCASARPVDQIDLCQKGATLILRNSKVEMFENHMRLVCTLSYVIVACSVHVPAAYNERTQREVEERGAKKGESNRRRKTRGEEASIHLCCALQAVDKWGLIEPSKEELKEEINLKENLSDTEYELVPAGEQ